MALHNERSNASQYIGFCSPLFCSKMSLCCDDNVMTYIKHNNPQSAYASHILNNKHEYGPFKTLCPYWSKLTNSFEQFYIHSHYHHTKRI